MTNLNTDTRESILDLNDPDVVIKTEKYPYIIMPPRNLNDPFDN